MVKVRKDSKGNILRTGECERKDGRYSFSYTVDKVRKVIYAKTLVELRIKEKKIKRDIEDGLDPGRADSMTLNQLFDKFIGQKYDIKNSTRVNYTYMYDRFVRNSLGRRVIGKIKYSDVKKFYQHLLENNAMKANTLETIHTVIHSAFAVAVRDDILRKNPADQVMGEIKKSHHWKKEKVHALEFSKQRAFVNYLKSHREYYGWVTIIIVLLGTGLRIGECLALRWDDLDFDKKLIRVKHTYTYKPNGKGHSEKHIESTKSDAGIRVIPMLDEVFEAFLQEYELQKCMGFCSEVIDGYTNFVFVKADGKIYSETAVNRAIHRIIDAYNREETENAEMENREPMLIPHFSAHVLRHTFCTRVCENESNIKVIQELMGHSDVSTTMNIYAEATEEKKQEVIAKLQGKIIM